MEDLAKELEHVKVVLPEDNPNASKPKAAPESHRCNNKKEKITLGYAENFKRQFRQLYGDRKALFLSPLNECGVEKFICTTICPTMLPYQELYDYDGAAAFVADYVTYQPLQEPVELPTTLSSPTLVLDQQKGNCFEMSVLLCSLLIGVGYDAYCVCGYATREMCLMDQTRRVCPLLEPEGEVEEASEPPPKNKYAARPPRDLTSKFEVRMAEKERGKMEEIKRRQREEEQAAQAEREKPPPDDLHGLRFHCWVLVLAGKREVPLSFFIEPTTSKTYSTDHEEYLGIESLWNHRNYWVNMQDCAEGVKNLVYDLGDSSRWEYFFPNVDKPLLIVPPGEDRPKESFDDDEGEQEEQLPQDDLDLPPSWVQPIQISQRDFEMRCPRGKRVVLYKRAKVEKFAEYLNQDGLVLRLALYSDLEMRQKKSVKEEFANREDCLYLRLTDCSTDQVVEHFRPGRKLALKEHTYFNHSPGPESTRTMTFFSEARVDGLVRCEETPTQMVQVYKGREDHLHYKQVNFAAWTKKFEPAETAYKRQIVSIIERFERDASKKADENVAERQFLLTENTIKLIYHLDDTRITASTREFETPPIGSDQAYNLTFLPDITSAYQADPYAKTPKNRVLYETLECLMEAQEASCAKVRASEQEIKNILETRAKEEVKCVLGISVYDVARNETAKQHRVQVEKRQAEEERLRKAKEVDYLAPYLARLGEPSTLTVGDVDQLKGDCLKDLRTRLVDLANIIQSRFEMETSELQKKQAWYQEHQSSLSRDEEEEYIEFCREAMFRIHILEQRLTRHKAIAPHKYREMELCLRSDTRLMV